MVLSTIALQAPLDSAHGYLPSDIYNLPEVYSAETSVKFGGLKLLIILLRHIQQSVI